MCVVSGLIIAQSLASPRDLAGITGVYYSLSYLGFLLPTILAALTPVLSYTGGLVIVAVICALCLSTVGIGLRRPPRTAAPVEIDEADEADDVLEGAPSPAEDLTLSR